MEHIKNQIKDSEIGSYVGGNVHIENIHLVIRPEAANSETICTAEKGSTFHDKKQYFAEKWKADLFLHQSGCDRKFTLQQAFIFPEYEINGQRCDDLEQRLEDFWENGQYSMLLLGTPGMGKTSIVAYLAEHYKEDSSMLFLRFKDLNMDADDGIGLLTAVCREMGCQSRELSGKKLIIDGFDEWRYTGDKQRLLQEFMLDLMNLDGVQILLTSRHNYINLHAEIDQVVKLLPFSKDKIGAFYQRFFGINLPADTKIRNLEVLGIPVILYMALSIGMDITTVMSKRGLYEKIFALEGGIFDRFKTKGQKPYEDGSHPVQYAKRELKTVLQKLAFEILRGNGKSVSSKTYEGLVQSVMGKNEQIVYDFPIKNLLEDDGTVEFIHKSIYEYFAAEYMFTEMQRGIQSRNEGIMAGIFGDMLGFAEVSDEVYAFLDHLACQSQRVYDWDFIYSVFLLMLKSGMTFFANTKSDINIVVRERRIFNDMLKIVHINHEGQITIGRDSGRDFACYLRLSDWFTCPNLSRFALRDMCLSRVILRRANLDEADLSRADLSGADLGGATLHETCLAGADLRGADLSGAVLAGANLSGADLIEANLSGTDLAGADFGGAYLGKADLSGANLSGANLQMAFLHRADLSGADLTGADLSGANLGKANLSGADLTGADLSGANLDRAKLSELKWNESVNDIFTQTGIIGAELAGAELSEADLTDADIGEADFDM